MLQVSLSNEYPVLIMIMYLKFIEGIQNSVRFNGHVTMEHSYEYLNSINL